MVEGAVAWGEVRGITCVVGSVVGMDTKQIWRLAFNESCYERRRLRLTGWGRGDFGRGDGLENVRGALWGKRGVGRGENKRIGAQKGTMGGGERGFCKEIRGEGQSFWRKRMWRRGRLAC